MSTVEQLALEFEHLPALSCEDFLVTSGNAEAVAWIDRWPDWPSPALAIFGPAGCGKSHLVEVFKALAGATAVTATDLEAKLLPLAGTLVFEDADRTLTSDREAPLLHLYNALAEAGGRLLVTGRTAPSHWPIRLADLASRLNVAPAVEIGAPDDELIAVVLVKLFADRQLRIEPDVVTYAVPRMERSFDAARRLVAVADSLALAEGRRITVPLVKQVLERLDES